MCFSLTLYLLQVCRTTCGEKHPSALAAARNLRAVLRSRGKYAEAEPFYREALELRHSTHGDKHVKTLIAMTNLATILENQHKFAGAEMLHRQVVDRRRVSLGNTHTDTLASISDLGMVLHRLGKDNEAEKLYREALEGRRTTLGETHPKTCLSVSNLGILLEENGSNEAAEVVYSRAASHLKGRLSDEDLAAHNSRLARASLTSDTGDNVVLSPIQPNQAENFRVLQAQKILTEEEIHIFNSGNLAHMLSALEKLNFALLTANKTARTQLQKKQLVMDSIISEFFLENSITDRTDRTDFSEASTHSYWDHHAPVSPCDEVHHAPSHAPSPRKNLTTPRTSLYIPDATTAVASSNLAFTGAQEVTIISPNVDRFGVVDEQREIANSPASPSRASDPMDDQRYATKVETAVQARSVPSVSENFNLSELGGLNLSTSPSADMLAQLASLDDTTLEELNGSPPSEHKTSAREVSPARGRGTEWRGRLSAGNTSAVSKGMTASTGIKIKKQKPPSEDDKDTAGVLVLSRSASMQSYPSHGLSKVDSKSKSSLETPVVRRDSRLASAGMDGSQIKRRVPRADSVTAVPRLALDTVTDQRHAGSTSDISGWMSEIHTS